GCEVSVTGVVTGLLAVVGVVYLSGDHFGQKGATRLPPHESGELRRRHCRVDVAEGSLVLQLVRGGDEPAHRGAIERAGEADATHASRFQLGYGERLARNTDHEIERLRDRGAHRLHRSEVRQAR